MSLGRSMRIVSMVAADGKLSPKILMLHGKVIKHMAKIRQLLDGGVLGAVGTEEKDSDRTATLAAYKEAELIMQSMRVIMDALTADVAHAANARAVNDLIDGLNSSKTEADRNARLLESDGSNPNAELQLDLYFQNAQRQYEQAINILDNAWEFRSALHDWSQASELVGRIAEVKSSVSSNLDKQAAVQAIKTETNEFRKKGAEYEKLIQRIIGRYIPKGDTITILKAHIKKLRETAAKVAELYNQAASISSEDSGSDPAAGEHKAE